MKSTGRHGEKRATLSPVGARATVAALTAAMLTAAGLSVAALAHPLLDVLANHPTFFAAHKADAWTLTIFAAATTLVTAVCGAAFVVLSRAMGHRVGKALTVGLLAFLVALICYRIGRQLPALQDAYLIVASAVFGLAMALIQERNATARFVTSVVGCTSAVLVPAYFLVRTLPMISAPSAGGEFGNQELKVEHPSPIVFVVFDALRLVELLDDDGHIDEASFPNFAGLSRQATWYRNTTTVAGFTVHAVPSLLTGKFPPTHSSGSRAGGPTLAAHPANLFTMLAGTYELFAEQPITDLCPASACKQVRDRHQILRDMISDSLALLPYIFGTTSHVATLPSIDAKWTGFASSASGSDRPRQLERATAWVDAVDRGSAPRLYFLHTLAPHKPFRYTAEGLKYQAPDPRLRSTTPGDGYKWTKEIATVAFEHSRYRMQAAAVDRLLGRLIERLEQLGIYDETLLVVTSDHGAAFMPGKSHRHYDESLQSELFFVPLFIKAPGQLEGKTDDRPVQSIDVLPTVLDLIGADQVEVDGRSLVDQRKHVGERFFIPPGKRGRIAVPDTGLSLLGAGSMLEANEHRATTAVIAPTGEPRPEPKNVTAPPAAQAATAIILPPTSSAAMAAASGPQERVDFVHGLVILDDPTAGWPEVEITLDGKPALLSGTFFGRETGRILFEGLVQSTSQPERVQEAIDVTLRWPSTGQTQERTAPWIERTTEQANSFLTVHNAFWYAFWQGHPASISCSDSYRRAFFTAWRGMAGKQETVGSLAHLIRRASTACAEDDEPLAPHVRDPGETCRCNILESELATPRAESPDIARQQSASSVTWDTHWNGFAFATACTDIVKERFGESYGADSPATWVRPPFVLLRGAIESCRNEMSVEPASDPLLCECFSFRWADTHDTQWAEHWDYSDPVKGPARAVGFAILEASKVLNTGAQG